MMWRLMALIQLENKSLIAIDRLHEILDVPSRFGHHIMFDIRLRLVFLIGLKTARNKHNMSPASSRHGFWFCIFFVWETPNRLFYSSNYRWVVFNICCFKHPKIGHKYCTCFFFFFSGTIFFGLSRPPIRFRMAGFYWLISMKFKPPLNFCLNFHWSHQGKMAGAVLSQRPGLPGLNTRWGPFETASSTVGLLLLVGGATHGKRNWLLVHQREQFVNHFQWDDFFAFLLDGFKHPTPKVFQGISCAALDLFRWCLFVVNWLCLVVATRSIRRG